MVWAAIRPLCTDSALSMARWRKCSPEATSWLLRRYTAQTSSTVLAQLRRVSELQSRAASENSKSRKQRIIAEYPDLRQILEHVYDPQHRSNLSFASLRKHISGIKISLSGGAPPTITELLDLLSTRQVTGDEAKNLVVQFLIDHDILSQDREIREDRKEELEVFGRLLDRNLVAGFGARTLSSINWGEPSSIDPATANPRSSEGTARLASAGKSCQEGGDSVVPPQRSLKAFPVALGKSIDPPFAEIAKSSCKWYASRKLDGVRVITFLDFLIPHQGQMSLQSAKFLSRTGKQFTSLAKVEEQLSILEKYPRVRDWLMGDVSTIQRTDEGIVKRVVLDGEVCVMREKKSQPGERTDEDTGAGTIWSDSDLEEDFASTVSEIRRGPPFTIPHPVYFLFDILPFGLFDNAKGASTFGKRVADIRNLGDWLDTQETGEKILRPLAQWEVKDGSEIDSMVARAAEEGWEGLVLRADKPYKGSRSSDIRKFKQWLDAEYTVIAVDNSRMRLAVDGVFGEYDAMANIWIEHKGTRVSVGSGFTADQRIKYGSNPDLIIGKEVTVEYFSESSAAGREGKSLRFPRVKQIWDEGKRTT